MHRFLVWLLPRLACLYLQFVGKTSKILWIGREHLELFEKSGKNVVYAFWHGRQISFACTHRHHKACVLVSQSKDGDYIAEVMRLIGMKAARGSSSRGALKGMKALLNSAKEGYHVGFTPDGPRGPFHEVKPGVIHAAQSLGFPIIPIANGMRFKLVFKGWDEFLIPLPFNRIAVVHEPAIWVGPQDSLEEKAKELKEALNKVTDKADEIALTGNV